MARPGIMLYFDILEPIRVLPDADKGRLLVAMLEYGKFGTLPEFDGMLALAWGFVKPKLDTVKAAIVAFCTALGAALGWKGLMLLTWVILMLLDWLSGTFAAMMAGEWCSKKSREGAWHKGGAILVVIVAIIADLIMLVICGNIPVLGIKWPNIILPLVLAWYILTELGSILENAIKLGANPPAWLTKILKSSLEIVESVGENAVEQSGEPVKGAVEAPLGDTDNR